MVERIFRLSKWKFKILNTASEYDMTTQVNLIFAITASYYYINNYKSQEIDYFKEEMDYITVSISTSNNVLFDTLQATFACKNRKRDVIVNKKWVDYTTYLAQHKFVI